MMNDMEWNAYCKRQSYKVIRLYEQFHHCKLHLDNPVTFTEKLQWLKIHDSTPLKAMCADKINVHKYFNKVLGSDIGIPINKIYNSVDEINATDINHPTVIKCNHGSGMNIVVNAPSRLSLTDIKTTIRLWLQEDHGNHFGELYYTLIKPTAFSEQYLPDITDIKLFCFNGKPKFYQVDRRFVEHRMNFYDLKWKPLSWLSRKDYPANYSIIDPKPPVDIIYDYAVKLCKPFKFVRCDFIVSNGHVYGGELTFIPGAGNQSYLGDGDRRLGDMLDL